MAEGSSDIGGHPFRGLDGAQIRSQGAAKGGVWDVTNREWNALF